jgi:sugar fermentation stimulation protein A
MFLSLLQFTTMDSGIYALLIRCPPCKINVGALGEIQIPAGFCVYIGSAQKNMEARISRHLRKNKTLRWHIDFLLTRASVVGHVEIQAPKSCEESIALALQRDYGYIKGFGASDSRAKSHLFIGEKENLWNATISLMKRCEND